MPPRRGGAFVDFWIKVTLSPSLFAVGGSGVGLGDWDVSFGVSEATIIAALLHCCPALPPERVEWSEVTGVGIFFFGLLSHSLCGVIIWLVDGYNFHAFGQRMASLVLSSELHGISELNIIIQSRQHTGLPVPPIQENFLILE